MSKNIFITKLCFVYVSIIFLVGFILVSQAGDTIVTATTTPIIDEGEECYETVDLNAKYYIRNVEDQIIEDYNGSPDNYCNLIFNQLRGYLTHTLPTTIDVTYTSRADYITTLVNRAIEICTVYYNSRSQSNNATSFCSTVSDSEVREAYLKSGGRIAILPDDYMMVQWAHGIITNLYNESRHESGGVISDTEPYYVSIPPYILSAPRHNPDFAPVSSHTTPLAVPISGTSEDWRDGGLYSGELTTADQWYITKEGRWRRMLQKDGTYQCFFYGFDGSYAILGICVDPPVDDE